MQHIYDDNPKYIPNVCTTCCLKSTPPGSMAVSTKPPGRALCHRGGSGGKERLCGGLTIMETH